jgi:hypothetical protein
MEIGKGKVVGTVTANGGVAAIAHAEITIAELMSSPVVKGALAKGGNNPVATECHIAQLRTDETGHYDYVLAPGQYVLRCQSFGDCRPPAAQRVTITECVATSADFDLQLSATPTLALLVDGKLVETVTQGQVVTLRADPANTTLFNYVWTTSAGNLIETGPQRNAREVHWDTNSLIGGHSATLTLGDKASPATLSLTAGTTALPRPVQRIDTVPVTMRRSAAEPTPDLPLWVVIRNSTQATSFENYMKFMDMLLCGIGRDAQGKKTAVETEFAALRLRRFLPYNDTDAYRLLKVATESFLMVNCGVAGEALSAVSFTSADLADVIRRVNVSSVDLNQLWTSYLKSVNGATNQTIPYLALVKSKLRESSLKDSIFASEDADLPQDCVGILRNKLTNPCLLELIWSYWHEQGMLVQTMNAISMRFQNVRGPAGSHDPLRMMEIDTLRPLNTLLWGYIQDEQHRLSLARRFGEYGHQYGLTMIGRAVPNYGLADNRSKFLEAFHNLLYLSALFYKEDDDTTVIADGFPVLNALKDVHLLLSEGAHNQFGDLPSTSRQEFMINQWLLARPEFREFLPTRLMVAYPEPWMDRVDAMKNIQGWTDTSVLHFHNLGVFGEQILLAVRFGAWSTVNDRDQAANWARYWRSEVQGYVHAYRAVTGVDLSAEAGGQGKNRFVQPSLHLRNRLLASQRQLVRR